MADTVRFFATPFKRGMHYGFFGGKAYMLTPSYLAKYGQISLSRQLTYMKVLLDLEKRYGREIPDCEFVISTTDTPNQNPVLPESDEQQAKGRTLLEQQQAQDERRQQPRSPRAAKAAARSHHALTHPFGKPGVPNGTFPVLRACKSAPFPDILIPSHDFYLLRYDTTVLRAAGNLTAAGELAPWDRRNPAAYGRYDLRKANRSLVDIGHVPAASDHHLTDLHTARHLALALVREELLGGGGRGTRPSHGAAEHASGGKGGGSIYNGGGDSGGTSGQAAAASAPGVSVLGSVDGDAATAEEAHQAYLLGVKHSAGWAEGEDEVAGAGSYAPGEVERLRTAPHLPAYLRAAAQHKLLVHVDGAGCSSALERLLPMGGVVLREESGYFGYYHQAMQPRQHYLPWWRRDPEDLYAEAAWASQHPDAAQAIAAAGAAFARGMLGSQGRACYWLAVLKRLAAAFTYQPKLSDFPRALPLARYRDEQVLRMRPGPGQRPLFGQPFEP
eukprot:XP_001696499.1 predicted protein [Chlamydomonas reinhardtii]